MVAVSLSLLSVKPKSYMWSLYDVTLVASLTVSQRTSLVCCQHSLHHETNAHVYSHNDDDDNCLLPKLADTMIFYDCIALITFLSKRCDDGTVRMHKL